MFQGYSEKWSATSDAGCWSSANSLTNSPCAAATGRAIASSAMPSIRLSVGICDFYAKPKVIYKTLHKSPISGLRGLELVRQESSGACDTALRRCLALVWNVISRRKKKEIRRKKEEGRRKKEEGRRQAGQA
ncbi:hypothetical protein [Microcoleus sp. bin38.metabat.b11b12b14.051]|uniref:hypothetical protein n=1 Tax=Microcoleus sp. bin38.metabat.b11b12b14.051 TaxID=2742709 RepID=UPI0025E73DAD|nr:hypothetical protein [Microcoleus sp. bin38.metabat.b11b12b14.051]